VCTPRHERTRARSIKLCIPIEIQRESREASASATNFTRERREISLSLSLEIFTAFLRLSDDTFARTRLLGRSKFQRRGGGRGGNLRRPGPFASRSGRFSLPRFLFLFLGILFISFYLGSWKPLGNLRPLISFARLVSRRNSTSTDRRF